MLVYSRCWSLWGLKCQCVCVICLLGGRFSNHAAQLWEAPWVLRKRTVTLTQKTSHLFSLKRHFWPPTVKDWTRRWGYILHMLDLCFLNKETWNIETWRIRYYMNSTVWKSCCGRLAFSTGSDVRCLWRVWQVWEPNKTVHVKTCQPKAPLVLLLLKLVNSEGN